MLSERRKEKNRSNLGNDLKEARVKAGFTQKALAEALGIEYYTMISQIELGYISIPAAIWVSTARVLNMDVEVWVLRCLTEYQPEVYRALFMNKSVLEVSDILRMLNRGQLDHLIKGEDNG